MNTQIVDFSGFTIELSSLSSDAHFKAGYESGENHACPYYVYDWTLCRNNENGDYEFWLVIDHFERGRWEGQELSQKIPVDKKIGEILVENFKNKDDAKDPCSIEEKKESGSEIESDLQELVKKVVERSKIEKEEFWHDVENDLNELISCLQNNLRRASLALCGRILELSLKIDLKQQGVRFEKGWGVGKLLSALEENDLYADDALKNIYNVINKQRIIGVHATELVPIPSKHQVFLVVHAIVDTLERTLSR